MWLTLFQSSFCAGATGGGGSATGVSAGAAGTATTIGASCALVSACATAGATSSATGSRRARRAAMFIMDERQKQLGCQRMPALQVAVTPTIPDGQVVGVGGDFDRADQFLTSRQDSQRTHRAARDPELLVDLGT